MAIVNSYVRNDQRVSNSGQSVDPYVHDWTQILLLKPCWNLLKSCTQPNTHGVCWSDCFHWTRSTASTYVTYTSCVSPFQLPKILAFSRWNHHVFPFTFHEIIMSPRFNSLPTTGVPAEELCGELQGIFRSPGTPPSEPASVSDFWMVATQWWWCWWQTDYGRSARFW